MCTLRSASHDYKDRDAHAGMEKIEEEIFSIDVIDVAVVGVRPFGGPGIDDLEPIPGVLEAGPALDDHGAIDYHGVLAAEVRPELFVGNVSALASGAFMARLLRLLSVLLMA